MRPTAEEPASPQPVEGIRTAKPEVVTPADDLNPSLSKDGRYLAYASELNGNRDIWIKDYAIDSSYPITTASADDFDPSISPKGGKVAYASRREDAKGDIFLASLDENDEKGKPEKLTDAATADRQPIFSPDGNRIYFTSAVGNGPEFISVLDLGTHERKRISPTPGIDPTISPDGNYLVYSAASTRPEGYRRLVALRLSDSSTRAITKGESPEGFARFVPKEALPAGMRHSIVYVRFADDDNRDGLIDANDHSSLWRLDLDLDQTFAHPTAKLEPPLPLTDGTADELFPEPTRFGLYFTQGEQQQDILRLPIDGMFPSYEEPSKYVELADAIDDPRTKWFVYRRLLARTPPSSLLHGKALLFVGNLHLSHDRPDLARKAYRDLADAMAGAKKESPEASLGSLARVELISLDRKEGLEKAVTPLDRERVLRAIESDLEKMAEGNAWSPRTSSRIDLELAELILDRGDRARAIEAFEEVARAHQAESYTAAKAMLREIDILGISHDPDALGEAYGRVLRLFPKERDAVRTAADRIVGVQLEGLQASEGHRGEVDALRRLIARYPPSPVRTSGRWRLVGVLRARGLLTDQALELERIVEESASDRLNAAKAFEALAGVEEERGRLEVARATLGKLRSAFGDLPGIAGRARDSINRVGLKEAQIKEERGDKEGAREVYRSIIENDLDQVRAHRRYLMLSAALGRIEEAVAEARTRALQHPRTPMARYAHGLALTWREPPDLAGAMAEIEESQRLNPKFVQLYITRGWILEMDPKGDQLAKAIDSYQTAKYLNQTQQDAETDLEISLNEANARYRLGTKTNDVGNVRAAFDRYVTVLNGRYRFLDDLRELVYWERFGRAAAWTEEWAVSAMATRQAIELARRLGHHARLPQLYGNLALAYAEAGESAYARQALNELAGDTRVESLGRKGVIEERNRALFKLSAVHERTPERLDSALWDLDRSRRTLAGLGKARVDFRGHRLKNEDTRFSDAPIWRPTVEDASSAQYGFTDLGELDVNLALSEQAHQRHGEETRAEAIRERRRFLWPQVLANLPKAFAFLPKAPTTLLMLREKLGLTLAAAHDRFEEGNFERARSLFEEAENELDRWRKDNQFDKIRAWLEIDRGRLIAVEVEYVVRSWSKGRDKYGDVAALGKKIDDQLQVLEDPRRALAGSETSTGADAPRKLADPVLEALPKALTSTLALATTASIALGVPRLAGLDLEARFVRGRLHYARGLLAMVPASTKANAEGKRGSSAAPTLRSLLAELDSGLSERRRARDAFEAAAHEAAGAGPWYGARLLALALDGVANSSMSIGDRSRSLVQATESTAKEIARAIGDEGLAAGFELAKMLASPSQDPGSALDLISKHVPRELGPIWPLVEETMVRSASVALGKKDIAGAIAAVDRWMLLRTAVSPHVSLSNALEPEDRAFGASLREKLDALEEAQRELARSDPTTSKQEMSQRKARVRERRKAIDSLKRDTLSDAGKARLFAEPVLIDSLLDDLHSDEALLIPVPIRGLIHLFWIDGSTTAQDRLGWRQIGPKASVFFDDLRAVRSALDRGQGAPLPQVQRLERALFSPLGAVLAGKRKVLLADALAGGPIPGPALFRGRHLSFSHLSSVSVLEALRAALVVGASGSVVIAGHEDPSLAKGDDRLGRDEALALRGIDAFIDRLGPGSSQKRARALAIERLAEKAHALVVVEAPVRLEPAALERSAIDLGGGKGAAKEKARTPTADSSIEHARGYEAELSEEAERFRSELPLDDLKLSARSLILARVEPDTHGALLAPIDSSDLVRLDLVLALRGFASTVVIPRAVPQPAIGRIIRAYTASVASQGPARALEEAIEAEAKTTPAAQLIALVGSPGLDARGTKQFAKGAVSVAKSRVFRLVKEKKFETLVPALERWIRLQLESGSDENLVVAYNNLIWVLSEKLEQPDQRRAADRQLDLLIYLREKHQKKVRDGEMQLEKAPAVRTSTVVAHARVDLGRLRSLAGEYPVAEHELKAAIEEFERAHDQLGVARAYFELGVHYYNQRNFKQEAGAIEKAIATAEAAKAFDLKATPKQLAADEGLRLALEAIGKAVRRAGEIYLNRLSDPAKAKQAYERAYRYATNDVDRNRIVMDLARVARRRGDFTEAADLAERGRASAVKSKRPDLETDALIEAANIAWYQGDYRKGQELCEQGLAAAKALKSDTVDLLKQKRRRKIFALSVCGVVSMSRRDFSRAVSDLEHAMQIARSIGDHAEMATQYNNLGRVYLEFGKFNEAIENFEQAKTKDEELANQYGLAYDFRNLGEAKAHNGDARGAKTDLEQALQFAIEVQDANNELRATFALAELARDAGQTEQATALYKKAQPLAKSLDVKELDWQIHRALGLIQEKLGSLDKARGELESAVQIARSLTGRAQSTDFGPNRYAAFDDLIALFLEEEKLEEAYRVADLARGLEQTELLDDSRIAFSSARVSRLLRAARTGSVAAPALEELEQAEPRLAEMVAPVSPAALAKRLKDDAAVIMYRVTDEELIAFVIDRQGLHARRTAVRARALREEIREYGRRLGARSDVLSSETALAKELIDPIHDLLAAKKRLAIVPHRLLHYVAFSALPFGTDLMIDHFTIVESLDPAAAVSALERPLGPISELPILALGAPQARPGEGDPPLPFAEKEIALIQEEYPKAELLSGAKVTKDALASAFGRAQGVLHFAGHSRMTPSEGGTASFVDPLGSELRVADGGLTFLDVLKSTTKARLVVLSACSTMLSRTARGEDSQAFGDELLSLAESFHLAGADNVLATTMHVSDVAAAIVMKRFYRAAKGSDAAAALREAQLVVRRLYPHPAWWATYVLLSRS